MLNLEWGKRTYLMGILNLTPDSFSGDGLGDNLADSIEQARQFEPHCDFLDLGGESTRPNAAPVDIPTELQRVLPVLQAIRPTTNKLISVDTLKPEVAEAALKAGADLVNDITGLSNPQMREVVARRQVPAIVMHMRGTPQTMMSLTDYGNDVVEALLNWFGDQLHELEKAGVRREQVIIDPGIGFAKTPVQNLEILHRLAEFKKLGRPILIGLSRKRFIGELVALPGSRELPPGTERDFGTAAACALAIAGGADIVRVHNAPAIWGAVRVADAIGRFAQKDLCSC